MAKSENNHITSCTIVWTSVDGMQSVTTKVLQTDVQVRLYSNGNLNGGRIWPMSAHQKQELYSVLYSCIEDWVCDDYKAFESDRNHWQFKICNQRSCIRTICGTYEPPHGAEIKRILAEIIGAENCYFF